MTNLQYSFYKTYINTHHKNTRKTFFSLFRKPFCVFLFIGNLILPTLAIAHTFSVPLVLTDRVDRSTADSPWLYMGPFTEEVEPIENPIGCAGTNYSGAPIRVTCDKSSSYLGPGFVCPDDVRNIHVGETVVDSVNFPTSPLGFFDGWNPTKCIKNHVGVTQALVDLDTIEIYGVSLRAMIYGKHITDRDMFDRWTCPFPSRATDIDNDGEKYDGYGWDGNFGKKRNPETCGTYKCPTGSKLSFSPFSPKAKSFYSETGRFINSYVCKGTKPEKQPHNICAGNPIIIATGNKYQTEPDYQSQKPFGLGFTRFYNSSAHDNSTDIGKKWRHNYGRHISVKDANALVYRGNGQAFDFNNPDYKNSGTQWLADTDISDTLVETFDENNTRSGWLYTTANNISELYNISGQLLSVTNRQGQSQTFIYTLPQTEGGDDNNATLDKITGFFGETLSFSYDASHRITGMTDPQGQHTHYGYDEIGNLNRATYPDNTEVSTDNPTRQYHYENTNYPHNLTGITDENNTRYVTWAYDEDGLATSSEHTGGIDKETLKYNEDDSVTVTNPLGKKTTYHFTSLHGVKKVSKVEGHATESCLGANQAYTYDENGYLASKTDWQGITTIYQYNAKGLELSRTEAKDTLEARTITTEWHTNFRLPIKITEPGKITKYSYDEQGRLLSQSSRDTK